MSVDVKEYSYSTCPPNKYVQFSSGVTGFVYMGSYFILSSVTVVYMYVLFCSALLLVQIVR